MAAKDRDFVGRIQQQAMYYTCEVILKSRESPNKASYPIPTPSHSSWFIPWETPTTALRRHSTKVLSVCHLIQLAPYNKALMQTCRCVQKTVWSSLKRGGALLLQEHCSMNALLSDASCEWGRMGYCLHAWVKPFIKSKRHSCVKAHRASLTRLLPITEEILQ